ncbi:unnamed protein product, partial [Gulo gulo]
RVEGSDRVPPWRVPQSPRRVPRSPQPPGPCWRPAAFSLCHWKALMLLASERIQQKLHSETSGRLRVGFPLDTRKFLNRVRWAPGAKECHGAAGPVQWEESPHRPVCGPPRGLDRLTQETSNGTCTGCGGPPRQFRGWMDVDRPLLPSPQGITEMTRAELRKPQPCPSDLPERRNPWPEPAWY